MSADDEGNLRNTQSKRVLGRKPVGVRQCDNVLCLYLQGPWGSGGGEQKVPGLFLNRAERSVHPTHPSADRRGCRSPHSFHPRLRVPKRGDLEGGQRKGTETKEIGHRQPRTRYLGPCTPCTPTLPQLQGGALTLSPSAPSMTVSYTRT